jgi:hypothetical protein
LVLRSGTRRLNTTNRMNNSHLNVCLKIQWFLQLKPNIDSIISNKQLRVSNNANKWMLF